GVRAAVGVGGGGGGRGGWPIALGFDGPAVKWCRTDAELLRLCAQFVERGEAVVNVKHRVLYSLGHNRPGELLKFQCEMLVRRALFRWEIFREAQQQKIAQKIED